jgi:hypothetical protein
MALTKYDIDTLDSHAELIAERVIQKVMDRMMQAHIDSCPHGRRLLILQSVALGAGVFGGSLLGQLISSSI